MNTRRKFLLQGSLATTALLTVKPFNTLANALSPITGYTVNDNSIVLVHTGAYNSAGRSQTIREISNLKKNMGNLVLLHAGQSVDDIAAHLNYDASTKAEECISLTGDYKIIYKGNIKVAVIRATPGDSLQSINDLSAYLKNQKDCRLVVCLSELGYKNKTSPDDIKLANSSTDIDVIIGGHATNFSPHPVAEQNRAKAEVIIQSDSGNGFAFRNIEINFDEKRNKKTIAINNLITRTAIYS